MQIRAGDVLRIRSWDHNTNGVRLTYGLGRQPKDQKTVMLMMVLGEEPFDESKPGLDLEKRMNDLGWFTKGKLKSDIERPDGEAILIESE